MRLGGLALALATLAGCTISGGGPGDPLSTESRQLQEAYVASLREPTPRVTGLELGRMRDGFLLSAFAQTATQGWSAALLRPRTPLMAADGMLEFDFVAAPPQPDTDKASAAGPEETQAEPPRRPATLRADRVLAPSLVAEAVGVRVFAREGSIEGRF